jgi:hypothetical protein
MIVIGLHLFIQNYRYWQKYGFNIYVYGFTAGGSFAFLGCWVIISHYLLPEFFTLDSHTVDLLTLSRHILFPVIFVYFVVTGYWQYFLNKS